MCVKWKRMWDFKDNQDVGSEAAIHSKRRMWDFKDNQDVGSEAAIHSKSA